MLQVKLCTPCNDEPSVLYTEGISMHLPNSTCKIASHGETNFISNYSKVVNFTIVSETLNKCQLFLATSSLRHFMSNSCLVQLGLHCRMEYVIVIPFSLLTMLNVTFMILLSDLLPTLV